MYFILVTVILSSLLLHPGLGEQPEDCPVVSSGEAIELKGINDSSLHVSFNIRTCVL